jgi:hypothetical protein
MKRLFIILALSTVVVFASCSGGGGGGGGGAPSGGLQPPTYNATGNWTVTETGKQGTCPSMTPNGTFNLTVDHPLGSNSLTVVDDKSGRSYAGTCDGSSVTYSGPGIDSNCPGGFSLSVTINMQSDSNLSGSSNWSCNYTGGSCTGTTFFIATKTGGGGDTTSPTAPTNLTGTVISSSQINLVWNASMDNVGVTAYLLERCLGASCNSFNQILTPTTASCNDTGLMALTSYTYRVRAVDAAGNLSGFSNTYIATTQSGGAGGDMTPPSVVTGLTSTIVSSHQINLSWLASQDNAGGSGLAGYKIYRSVTGGSFIFQKNVTTGTATPDTNLSASTLYCYKVSAFDLSNNESAQSAQECRTTTAVPSYTLAVKKGGTGSGTVTGTGISCGTTCSHAYAEGTVVTLAATTDTGSTFNGWLGCDSATGTSCTVTLNQNKDVTASFTQTGFSLGVTITNLPATSTTGNYTLQWACTGMICTNVFTMQEASDTSFSSPLSYYFYSAETSYTFSGKANGTYCYRVGINVAGSMRWSDPKCIAVAKPTAATLHIVNNTHYDMLDIQLDSAQKIFFPYVIYPGNAADFAFTSTHQVSYVLGVGFYDSTGLKEEWFTGSGNQNVTVGQTSTLTLSNPTLGQMLTGFNAGGRDWYGTYYCYSCANMVHTKRFHFNYNGSWTLYDDNVQVGSGTATLVSWPDYSSYIRFNLGSTCVNVDLWAPWGTFSCQNGPADWPTIEYVMH